MFSQDSHPRSKSNLLPGGGTGSHGRSQRIVGRTSDRADELKKLADNSEGVRQLKTYQLMADDSAQVKQTNTYQQLADRHTSQQKNNSHHTIQRKEDFLSARPLQRKISYKRKGGYQNEEQLLAALYRLYPETEQARIAKLVRKFRDFPKHTFYASGVFKKVVDRMATGDSGKPIKGQFAVASGSDSKSRHGIKLPNRASRAGDEDKKSAMSSFNFSSVTLGRATIWEDEETASITFHDRQTDGDFHAEDGLIEQITEYLTKKKSKKKKRLKLNLTINNFFCSHSSTKKKDKTKNCLSNILKLQETFHFDHFHVYFKNAYGERSEMETHIKELSDAGIKATAFSLSDDDPAFTAEGLVEASDSEDEKRTSSSSRGGGSGSRGRGRGRRGRGRGGSGSGARAPATAAAVYQGSDDDRKHRSDDEEEENEKEKAVESKQKKKERAGSYKKRQIDTEDNDGGDGSGDEHDRTSDEAEGDEWDTDYHSHLADWSGGGGGGGGGGAGGTGSGAGRETADRKESESKRGPKKDVAKAAADHEEDGGELDDEEEDARSATKRKKVSSARAGQTPGKRGRWGSDRNRSDALSARGRGGSATARRTSSRRGGAGSGKERFIDKVVEVNGRLYKPTHPKVRDTGQCFWDTMHFVYGVSLAALQTAADATGRAFNEEMDVDLIDTFLQVLSDTTLNQYVGSIDHIDMVHLRHIRSEPIGAQGAGGLPVVNVHIAYFNMDGQGHFVPPI